MPSLLPFTVKQDPEWPQVTHVYVDLHKFDEASFLLRGDAHHDNKKCVREIEYEHLKEAKRRDAGIIDGGDCFCAMQGKYDKRSSQSQIRDEHRGDDYLDRLVKTTVEDYADYAPNWVIAIEGNHETSVEERNGVHLTRRLVDEFRHGGSQCVFGTYQGWIYFHLDIDGRGMSYNYKIRYTHGYGGGGPVTKDLIQLNRQLAVVEMADMFMSSHTHDKWHVKCPREFIDDKGRPRLHIVDAVKLGTYKDQWSSGRGWAVGRGHAPKPWGGFWLRFRRAHSQFKRQIVDACEDW